MFIHCLFFCFIFITQEVTPISGQTSDKMSNCLYFDAFADNFPRIEEDKEYSTFYMLGF